MFCTDNEWEILTIFANFWVIFGEEIPSPEAKKK